ncbi:uncharacterized protein LAJ45_00947 [Morchella importuna]|uniref:uncharacterized protein n=1 Tax=Morchella importuna TaxID=1174673 RepID=UPI001E8EECBD|nr:uncharacterized protein LAJ45_00947 [Morchella importuna]KAH8154420.1 hypothetical protein LAJ45_00947 [Morchella importuna]
MKASKPPTPLASSPVTLLTPFLAIALVLLHRVAPLALTMEASVCRSLLESMHQFTPCSTGRATPWREY